MARPRKQHPSGAQVKSAIRALELLEFFDRIERPATISELSRALGYPQSSTSMLVSSLVDQGYLSVTPGREVQPTARVSLLGRWMDLWIADGRVSQLMAELSRETGETILLGITNDVHVLYIDAIAAIKPMRLHIPRGTRRPLLTSGMGALLLSAMDDAEIARRVDSVARRTGPDDPRPPTLDEVMQDVAQVRRQGYSLSTDRLFPGAGVVCCLLPREVRDQPIGVGIGGLSAAISGNVEAYVELLHSGIRRHLEG
ncbi:IclR family transcriptional regulator [Xanthobacter wiegelii]|uniref:IclR family transcriptional regulator n=1 Tax=Xanthobacter wiegelii TaxID=3119913 RepID=UPI00372C664F